MNSLISLWSFVAETSLRAGVLMSGPSTPVELEFGQVEKA